MKTFLMSDPDDQTNPFEGLAHGTMLIYHGTNSMFCTPIEQKGLLFDAFDAAFGRNVEEIIAACDKLYVGPDGLASARGFSSKRQVYLSAMFASARGYARNIGGERIDGALRAAHGFLSFVRDSHRVQLQAAHWERVLMQNGPHLETEQVLANLRNADLLGKLADQVEKAHSELHAAISQGFPVVYAVRSDRKWIGPHEAASAGCHREPFGGVRADEVLPVDLLARVDYPNGISEKSE
jgi:hypothetical protein